jgi:ADP-ribose pyrophosphatase
VADPTPVVRTRTERLSPWVTLVAREVLLPGMVQAEEYHSLAQADYVTILGVTPDGRVPLVRQYRPALERVTLELPGGIRDGDEDPAQSASREVFEETGYRLAGSPKLLGRLAPDSGRLENRFWCFCGTLVPTADPAWRAEPRVECVVWEKRELRAAILDGRFDHALHIGLIGLALTRGLFWWD